MGMKLNPNKNVPEMAGTETGQMAVQFEKEETYLHMVMRRFLKHRLACVGVVVFLLILLIALLAPVIAPQDPAKIFNEFEAPPSAAHWLGTDPVGRDVMSRLIFGAQVSVAVGIGAVAIYVAIGIVLGLVAGYFGGWVDMLIMRLTDVFMSFPYFMVILVLVSIIGPSLFNITLVIGLLGWPAIARLVRGSVLSIKEMDYVKAGVALGYSTPKILFQHILPNALAPILVNATFGVASAIIMEASLSFLGMGVRPPAASWGNMLTQAESITVLSSQPWLWIPPGLMILLAVLSVNFIGDGLRDAIESQNAK
ncbi:oligopeptide ABC transporter permease [Sporolactobacillus terrae]|uniref:ABC transporter permease n=1 Tax=Sporolactobacillus terrae TaxID=269673 RepID=A0A410D6N5_9BACL|nr:oligopeptide ABC transporter permease [Sporolactobacillus terrae]QAA21754.1 ABC transporter permease [Sporolactobacillus terrae]QAA24727.1 ABC transporter permease [Sporolactobacillus terrae]UAK16557.1 ABC transporter permease [Sporolactobacillus terrae]BBN98026.1 peptide ABC transporter permease [Sporolactobacillus terrae]